MGNIVFWGCTDEKKMFYPQYVPLVRVFFKSKFDMSFSLTVIGCGSATPVGHRLSSAFALRCRQRVFMLDCGEGSQMYLKDNHIHMQRISKVLISHLHGDHFFGLVGLISSMHLFGRKHQLTVYAPPALEQIVRYQLEVGGTELNYPLSFVATRTDGCDLLFEDQELQVFSFPLRHSVPTTGFLFREKAKERAVSPPKSFAYCSDTAYEESIIPYISGVDLLYHEATFLENERQLAEDRLHATAEQAAKMARLAGVKKLLLGHFSARYAALEPFIEEAQRCFPDVMLASEGLTVNV
jgi:ribonuclease Z